jgi:hypothetical protein
MSYRYRRKKRAPKKQRPFVDPRMSQDEQDIQWIKKNRDIAVKRIRESASKFVLVKRFSVTRRAGLKVAIEQGTVEIISTTFGPAYALKGEHKYT